VKNFSNLPNYNASKKCFNLVEIEMSVKNYRKIKFLNRKYIKWKTFEREILDAAKGKAV